MRHVPKGAINTASQLEGFLQIFERGGGGLNTLFYYLATCLVGSKQILRRWGVQAHNFTTWLRACLAIGFATCESYQAAYHLPRGVWNIPLCCLPPSTILPINGKRSSSSAPGDPVNSPSLDERLPSITITVPRLL